MSNLDLKSLPAGFGYVQGRAYTHCDDLIEVMAARFLAAYTHLVRQRHARRMSFKRNSMRPGKRDFRLASSYKQIRALLWNLHDQGITDPELFTAFVFERWLLDGHNREGLKVKIRGKSYDFNAMPGMGYPSLKYICKNWRDLIAEFQRSCPTGWKPTQYVLMS